MEEIRTALALMNSMILSGESHSDQSESIYHKAMEALDKPHPEQAEGSSLGELVSEINENVEVVMFCGPTDQMDADEPRATMTITGPKRLISPLADKFC